MKQSATPNTAFWVGFEKQAGLWNRIATSGVGQMTGLRHLTSGVKQVGKLMSSGAISEAGHLVNPAMQGAAAGAHQNLMTGAKRLGGTALAAGGALYAGKRMLSSPQQQPQQAPAQMPTYQ